MIIILQQGRPLSSPFANNLETYNEIFTLLFLYMLLCFSSWVLDAEVSHQVGVAFIAFIAIFAVGHIVLMTIPVVR